jgi:hypothetical protein
MKKKRGIMEDKSGQFFLIAAVIIIAVIVSIVTVTNFTQSQDVVRLYDLGDELGIESQQVLDYGTYSELSEAEMKVLIENFATRYKDYIGTDKNIYFVFGNKKKINVLGYQQIQEESVEVCFDVGGSAQGKGAIESKQCVPYLTIGETGEFSKTTGEDINEVKIKISSEEYQFKLKEGENFYFVIWQEIGGEKHVVTSGE